MNAALETFQQGRHTLAGRPVEIALELIERKIIRQRLALFQSAHSTNALSAI